MEFGLIAKKLGHSFSPAIHAMIGGYDYQLCELTEDELPAFLKARQFRGLNVTIPYKETVIPLLDHISDEARQIGAVNTVVNRDGTLWGYNTDLGGMTALAQHAGVSLAGKTVLIAGSGGTSKTAAAMARAMGASQVLRAGRRSQSGCVSYEEAYCSGAQILINTTPCGMFPDTESCAVDLDRLPRLEGVLDAVFNPLRTALVIGAQARGLAAEGGLYMLVAQAVLASALFTGRACPDGTVERIYRALLRQKENVVLTGMPGSGKSTVGRLLAQELKRPFFDLDEVIAAEAGCAIPEIFAKEGEPGFRARESAAVATMASQTGAVIATGGGCILRQENVDRLRRNGRLYFLDRPPEELLPTGDRPLSDTADKLKQLYTQRLPRYRQTADRTVAVAGGADSVARQIAADYR